MTAAMAGTRLRMRQPFFLRIPRSVSSPLSSSSSVFFFRPSRPPHQDGILLLPRLTIVQPHHEQLGLDLAAAHRPQLQPGDIPEGAAIAAKCSLLSLILLQKFPQLGLSHSVAIEGLDGGAPFALQFRRGHQAVFLPAELLQPGIMLQRPLGLAAMGQGPHEIDAEFLRYRDQRDDAGAQPDRLLVLTGPQERARQLAAHAQIQRPVVRIEMDAPELAGRLRHEIAGVKCARLTGQLLKRGGLLHRQGLPGQSVEGLGVQPGLPVQGQRQYAPP